MFVLANIFQPLIDVFQSILTFFHANLGVPWGWAIVLLTVAMRLVLLPLTIKQFHSMQALQRLQPQMKALQAKYKEDKQRQQQELMKFYKENNVNPLGSCLPMVLQLPVFISLFYMLRQSLRKDICPTVLRHYAHLHNVSFAVAAGKKACGSAPGASFLFINDLTNNAHGLVLVALIVLYVGTQLASTLMMSTPTMDRTQRRIMMIMPVFFVIFVVNFPAGLLVYWITTNTWTMGQQFLLRRWITPPQPALAVADGAPAPSNGRSGGSNGPRVSAPRAGKGESKPEANGGASGGLGLSGLLRGKPKAEETPAPRPAQTRTTAPPRPPRKKKKRSGRRR
jgi:YidC/Oxa1 family membrane protein insertase